MTTQLDKVIGLSIAEAAYGTPTTPSKFLEFTDESLDWMPTFTQGQGLRYGSFVARAARRKLSKQRAGGDIGMEVGSRMFGALLKLAMGAVTSTQRGATGVYQHNFTLTPTDPLDSVTIQKSLPLVGGGAMQPHTFRGCVCSALEVTSPNGDYVTAKASFDARDVDTTLMSFAAPSYPTPIEPFSFIDAALVIGGTVTPATTTALATGGTTVADVQDWSLKLDNGLDDSGTTYASNGLGRRQHKPGTGLRAITGKITAEFDTTTLRDAYLNQLDLALMFTLTGQTTIGTGTDKPALQFLVPNIRLEGELPQGSGEKYVTQSINYTGFDPLTGASPLQVSYATLDSIA